MRRALTTEPTVAQHVLTLRAPLIVLISFAGTCLARAFEQMTAVESASGRPGQSDAMGSLLEGSATFNLLAAAAVLVAAACAAVFSPLDATVRRYVRAAAWIMTASGVIGVVQAIVRAAISGLWNTVFYMAIGPATAIMLCGCALVALRTDGLRARSATVATAGLVLGLGAIVGTSVNLAMDGQLGMSPSPATIFGSVLSGGLAVPLLLAVALLVSVPAIRHVSASQILGSTLIVAALAGIGILTARFALAGTTDSPTIQVCVALSSAIAAAWATRVLGRMPQPALATV